MPVYLLSFGQVEVVEVQAIFRAGKNYLPVPGLASYTGRMMQEGTASYNSLELSQQLDSFGAWISTETDEETMAFKLATTTQNLNETLPLLKEVMLSPTFPEDEFTYMKMRGIQAAKVNAQKTNIQARRHFNHQLFGPSHPYGLNASQAEIEALQLVAIKDYHQRLLQPGNMSLAVVGIFEEESLLASLEEKFGTLDRSGAEPEPASFPDMINNRGRHYVEQEGMQATLRLGHPAVSRSHPDYYKLNLLNTVLGGYFGSRLMKNIREEKGYTYGIYSGYIGMKHNGVFVVQADVGNEYIEPTIREVKKEIQLLQEKGIEEEELQLVKNYLLGKSISDRETPFQMGDWLRFSLAYDITFEELDKRFEVIKEIQKEEIAQLASTYLHPDEMLEVVVGKM